MKYTLLFLLALIITVYFIWYFNASEEVAPTLLASIDTVNDKSGGAPRPAGITLSFKGRKSLTIVSDVGNGIIAPRPIKIVKINERQYMFLGHSNPGGGLSRFHVFSVFIGSDRVEIKHDLSYLISRSAQGVVLSKLRPNSFGLVVPSIDPQNAYEWELSIDGEVSSFSNLRKHHISVEKVDHLDSCEFQDFFDDTGMEISAIMVIWCSVESDGSIKLAPLEDGNGAKINSAMKKKGAVLK